MTTSIKPFEMKTVFADKYTAGMPPCAATIGFFDGVHKGHRYLIKAVTDSAAAHGSLQSTIITFDRHPSTVVGKKPYTRLLTTTAEKIERLSETGADNCVVMHFDTEMAAMSAYDFMKDMLRDRLNVKILIIGYDNRFGHNRSEGFTDYVRYGRELGIDVVQAHTFTMNGMQVCSSVIRSLLDGGSVSMANMCLGYDYSMTGLVVSGHHEGTRLGFPTANIEVADPLKLIPRRGVYAVNVRIDGAAERMHGMMNIGLRPTFGNGNTTIEINIFNFEGDIYGHTLTVEVHARLRDEHRFDSVDELAEQLHADRDTAIEALKC